MRALRLGVAALFVLAAPLLTAARADANLEPPCSASGTLNGVTYDAAKVNAATIPRTGDVHWKGSIPGSGTRAIDGKVVVKLPWPIPEQTLGSWTKESDSYENSGVYHYDLPSVLAGVDIPVSGDHTEHGKTCLGSVVVRIEGGGASNPVVIGTFVVFIISGVGLWVSFRPKGV